MSAPILETVVLGTAEVKAGFLDAGSAIRARVRRALADLGADARNAAKARAPVASGRLSASIRSKLVESNGSLVVTIGPPRFYGLYLEAGVAEKLITVKKHRVRSRDVVGVKGIRMVDGVAKLRRGVISKGEGSTYQRRHHVPRRPFMGPAFDQIRERVQGAIDEAIRLGVADARG